MIPNSDRTKLTEARDFQTLNISEYIATLVNMINTAKHGYSPDDCSSVFFGLSGAIGSLLPLLNTRDFILEHGNRYEARPYLRQQLNILERQTTQLYIKPRNYRIKYVIRCSKVLRAMMTFGNRYGFGVREKASTSINIDDALNDEEIC